MSARLRVGVACPARQVADVIEGTLAAIEEHSKASYRIVRGVDQIRTVNLETARGISDIARATDELGRMATELQTIAGQFRLSS
ncbi:MAG: hypothetical protein HYX75_02260 [Acidobacteria bacterium]|nr:hypothetical protein [Acidobacteriota bacterium]